MSGAAEKGNINGDKVAVPDITGKKDDKGLGNILQTDEGPTFMYKTKHNTYGDGEDIEPQQEAGVQGGGQEMVGRIDSSITAKADDAEFVYPRLVKVTFNDGKMVV